MVLSVPILKHFRVLNLCLLVSPGSSVAKHWPANVAIGGWRPARSRDIFLIVFKMKVCCVFSLESPH